MSEMKRIDMEPGHHIIGTVSNGMVDVHDIVHDGISEKSITGEKPDLHPIPVSELEPIRRKHGFNDPIV